MRSAQQIRAVLHLVTQVTDRHLTLIFGANAAVVIVAGALAALSPLALKLLVDTAAPGAGAGRLNSDALLMPSALYVAVLCGGRIAADMRSALAIEIEQRLMCALRQRFFSHVVHLPLASLLRRRSGEMLHSLELGRAGAQLIVNHLLHSVIPVVVELTVMAMILVQLSQPLLIVLFGVTAFLYVGVFTAGALRLVRNVAGITATSMAVHGQLADHLSHVETLRCFGAEDAAERDLATASSEQLGHWRGYRRTSATTALAATAVFSLALMTCLFITTEKVADGSLSVGGLVLSSVYLLQMMRPLELLSAAARDVSRALGFVQPLLGLLGESQEELGTFPPDAKTPDREHAPCIRFEGLTFGYEPGRPVLRNLDFEIPAGRTTAIVGPSGSGKSSLIRLLLRLYTPQSGRILLDGESIDNLALHELRKRMALVPQDVALLHASIAHNLALGMPDARQEDIVQAAVAAQFHKLAHGLPKGYDTVVGERGLMLSGGERQRLAIARALIRRSPVLLLDEPTSMLDSQTESEVLRALKAATAGATTLIVAHRLSTVMDADEIIVLDKGRLRERGNHAGLLAQNGLYAQLWRRQVQGHDLTNGEEPRFNTR